MKASSFPPELSEGVCVEVSERTASGYRLKCGQIDLFSVPTSFFFVPRRNQLTQIVTVNAEIFVLAHQDPKLRHILSRTINTIDGRVLQWVCKCFYPAREILRLAGADFIYNLAAHCCLHGQRLFLLGSSEKANGKAARVLRDRYSGLEVSGFAPPLEESPFEATCRQSILDRIKSFRPEHLVVCFGPAKQECWIHENSSFLAKIGVRCAYGLGASIDFVSGVRRRAPEWIQFIGAEWLFRLACEPRARFRRTLIMFKMPVYAAKTARRIEHINCI